MITKERLKELIEQGATVYYVKHRDASVYVKPLTLEKDYKAEFIYRNLMLDEKDLYEHKADAEWDLEFGNVEKRIKFVKPKPFKKLGKWPTFLYKNHGFDMQKGYGGRLYVYYKDDFIYSNAFNEENYIEACRLIKKLFMGEE